MALDINALRQKLNKFQGQNDRKSSLWRPEGGSTTVRIVPWKEDPTNPFIERQFHYLGTRTYLSPVTFGRPDPLLDFARSILDEAGDDKDARALAWATAKNFMPKARTYVPVIVRGEEDMGVRFWSFGKTVYQSILQTVTDPDWGDITDVATGRDFVVNYIPREKSDTNFPKTDILFKPNTSPLSNDSDQIKEWLENQPDIDLLYTEPTYEELVRVLNNYVNPEGDISETQKYTTPDVIKETDTVDEFDTDDSDAPAATGASSTNHMSEFDQLFNN